MDDGSLRGEAVALPAATILLVRDAGDGIEVFMVKRHHQIEFAAGALVFPGGKASPADFDAGLADVVDGVSGRPPHLKALAATAIREAFEEAGVLLARDAETGELVGETRLVALDHYREQIEKAEVTLLDMLRRERLRLACDELVHFAHWITPKAMSKRFDTHFFLARAPQGHAGSHDGRESVDSLWVRPEDAISNRQDWNIMFPTRLNLMKLARAKNVADALATARAAEPVTVEPWVEQGPSGKLLRIRDDAGYDTTVFAMREAG